ncbi:hypothetical protein A5685_20495 [Mycobacterium colombiense]|uniref:Uncharacterized protein n=1 Tax=Mycobacterium colombiense TaxID=339268 RepID=A0A1A2SLJ5_9MYCO|nr:hypothetical protein A5685_20495 [Mycobacterium colombiense]
MRSRTWREIQADVDALRAALSRFQALSWEALTPAELVDVLGKYVFLTGRLDALIYELRSPFAWPSGRRT